MVILLAWILYVVGFKTLEAISQDVVNRMFGQNISFQGDSTTHIRMKSRESDVATLKITFPALNPSIPAEQQASLDEWELPQSFLLTVEFQDGRRRDLFFQPDADSVDNLWTWKMEALAAPDGDPPQQIVKKPGNENVTTARPIYDQLGRQVNEWWIKESLTSRSDPAILVAWGLADHAYNRQRILSLDPLANANLNVQAIAGKSFKSVKQWNSSLAGGANIAPRFRGMSFVDPALIMLWGVVLVVVLIPSDHRKAWPLETPG